MAVAGELRRVRQGLRSLRDPRRPQLKAWLAINGDKTLRLNYDLGPHSIVLDVGGYEGQWASDIYAMYRSEIHIFEPVSAFSCSIAARFLHNPNIQCHPFGLANADKMVNIGLDGDASGLYLRRGREPSYEGVTLRALDAFLQDHGIERVDLMKINIEGGEYELLEHMLDLDLHKGVENIQVQFHPVLPDSRERMRMIQSRLAETHRCTYAFEFVWENWQRLTT